ncbi:MAG TPA: peptidase M16 [Rhodospirillaceae bacterium]|nr:peptidase M16 [Rhodospirillaceae bacterium]
MNMNSLFVRHREARSAVAIHLSLRHPKNGLPRSLRSFAMTGLIVSLFLLPLPTNAANPVITEVTSASGVKAWLVQDSKLPLIALRFAFRGGVETDPADKQGLAVLTTTMMMQGAGAYDDSAFQERLAASSIAMEISAGRDYVAGEVKTLSRKKEEAFHLLALVLTQPRFDQTVLDRVRGQQQTAVTAQLAKPAWQARYALYTHLFGAHPYGYRSLGTVASLNKITREDMVSFTQSRFARDTLFVSVVGDITPDELRTRLDQLFGALPEKAKTQDIAPVTLPEKPMSVLTKREGTQTNIIFAAPTLMRRDPDWYAAEIANYILGGGGFIARLMKAVRAREGLTYGIATGLAPTEKTSLLMGGFDVDNGKAAEALALVKRVWQDFYAKGVSEDEVQAAKDYLIGSAPLSLTSTDAIADALLSMQTQELGIDYLDRRDALYRTVTREDVSRVITQYFAPSALSFSFVGKPDGVTTDKVQDLVKE